MSISDQWIVSKGDEEQDLITKMRASNSLILLGVLAGNV